MKTIIASNKEIIRSVNNNPVNPISDLFTVNLIDWSKFNEEITSDVVEKYPERAGQRFEADKRYCGVIIHDNMFLLITEEACATIAKDNKVEVSVFEVAEKGFFSIAPTFNAKVKVEDMKKYFTGETKKLPDFMGERYQYNPRIANNELQLIKFLSKQKINK